MWQDEEFVEGKGNTATPEGSGGKQGGKRDWIKIKIWQEWNEVGWKQGEGGGVRPEYR